MKKMYFEQMLSILNGIGEATPEMIDNLKKEIEKEVYKGEAKAQANREMYASAKDIILGALTETPVTIAELYDEIANELPDGFSKSKVQYAVTRLWADEVTKVEGKVNAYARKA